MPSFYRRQECYSYWNADPNISIIKTVLIVYLASKHTHFFHCIHRNEAFVFGFGIRIRILYSDSVFVFGFFSKHYAICVFRLRFGNLKSLDPDFASWSDPSVALDFTLDWTHRSTISITSNFYVSIYRQSYIRVLLSIK